MKHYGTTQVGWIFALAVTLAGAAPAAAQQPTAGEGVARLTGWPAFLHTDAPLPEDADTLGLVPAIDTLALRYQYAAGVETPRMTFALAWIPGEAALHQDERISYGALPATPQITGLALHADVLVEGRRVAGVVVAVDSVALGPVPDTLRFEAVGLTYANVFPGTSAEEARRIFEAGFRLDSLRIADVAFEAGMDRWPGPPIGRPRPRPRRPVYAPEPRGGIWIGGLFDPDPPDVDFDEPGGDYAPRGETVGRGSGDDSDHRGRRGNREDDTNRDGRNGERTGREDDARGRSNSEDDDEEEESLTEEALIAASIVGIVAYGGGTVGYAGTTATPIGLTAGRVYPQGGVLLQGSINQAVFMDASEQPDRLVVRLLGFYNLFDLPVQPAAGLGVVLTGREATDVAPSLSLGLAGNFGRLVILGGYDLLREEVTFGMAVNFRFRKKREPVVAER